MVFNQSSDSTDPRLLERASKALGHVARSGTLTSEIVEFEIKRAFEWLESKLERRHAAVLVLRELAEATPTLFNVYVPTFLDHIWVTLRDQKETIREAAIEALRACLSLVATRASKMRAQWYSKIFLEVQQSFKSGNADSIHGALLVIGELLRNTGEFMLGRFKEVCDTVLMYRDHKDRLVKEAVVRLLPQLASFEPEAFVRGYLDICLKHIIETLKTNPNKGATFLALGHLAIAVKDNIVPQLTTIVALIKENLKPKSSTTFNPNALTCVSMLARAVGAKLIPHMKDLVGMR